MNKILIAIPSNRINKSDFVLHELMRIMAARQDVEVAVLETELEISLTPSEPPEVSSMLMDCVPESMEAWKLPDLGPDRRERQVMKSRRRRHAQRHAYRDKKWRV